MVLNVHRNHKTCETFNRIYIYTARSANWKMIVKPPSLRMAICKLPGRQNVQQNKKRHQLMVISWCITDTTPASLITQELQQTWFQFGAAWSCDIDIPVSHQTVPAVSPRCLVGFFLLLFSNGVTLAMRKMTARCPRNIHPTFCGFCFTTALPSVMGVLWHLFCSKADICRSP